MSKIWLSRMSRQNKLIRLRLEARGHCVLLAGKPRKGSTWPSGRSGPRHPGHDPAGYARPRCGIKLSRTRDPGHPDHALSPSARRTLQRPAFRKDSAYVRKPYDAAGAVFGLSKDMSARSPRPDGRAQAGGAPEKLQEKLIEIEKQFFRRRRRPLRERSQTRIQGDKTGRPDRTSRAKKYPDH